MSEGLLSQFSLAKEKIDRVKGKASNDRDGDGEDETSEQGREGILLVRMYKVRGMGRCHDRSLTRKEHVRQHISYRYVRWSQQQRQRRKERSY